MNPPIRRNMRKRRSAARGGGSPISPPPQKTTCPARTLRCKLMTRHVIQIMKMNRSASENVLVLRHFQRRSLSPLPSHALLQSLSSRIPTRLPKTQPPSTFLRQVHQQLPQQECPLLPPRLPRRRAVRLETPPAKGKCERVVVFQEVEAQPARCLFPSNLFDDCKTAHVEAAEEGRRQAEAIVKELSAQVAKLTKDLNNVRAKVKYHCTQKYRLREGMLSTLSRLEHIADDETPVPQHPCDCGKPPHSRGRHPSTCASVNGVPTPVCDCQKVGPRSRHFPTCATKRVDTGVKRLRGDDITKVVADLRSLLGTSAAAYDKPQGHTKVATSDLTAPVLLRCIEMLGRGSKCAEFFDVGRSSVEHILKKHARAGVSAMSASQYWPSPNTTRLSASTLPRRC